MFNMYGKVQYLLWEENIVIFVICGFYLQGMLCTACIGNLLGNINMKITIKIMT